MAGFAGSNSIDERRRRRLAKDWDEAIPASAQSNSTEENTPEAASQDTNFSMPRHFPLRKIISPKSWKIAIAAGMTFGTALLSLLAGYYPHNVQSMFGPGIAGLFNMQTGNFFTSYTGCLLLMAGQLALLIWWCRSQNMRDFEGSFRIWPYAAITALVAACVLFSGAHHAWSSTFHWLWPVAFWKKEIVCWLAPTLAVVSSLILALHRDMRDSKISILFLWLAASGWSGAAVMSLQLELPVSISQPEYVLQTMQLIAAVCFFNSMLFHTRYVVHISSEAPVQRTSRIQQLWRRWQLHRRKRLAEKRLNEEISSTADSKSVKTRATRTKRSTSSQTTTKNTVSKTKPAAVAKSVKKKDEPEKAEPAVDTTSLDTNSDQFKGLSKKERRKLRKQMREEQRAA